MAVRDASESDGQLHRDRRIDAMQSNKPRREVIRNPSGCIRRMAPLPGNLRSKLVNAQGAQHFLGPVREPLERSSRARAQPCAAKALGKDSMARLLI